MSPHFHCWNPLHSLEVWIEHMHCNAVELIWIRFCSDILRVESPNIEVWLQPEMEFPSWVLIWSSRVCDQYKCKPMTIKVLVEILYPKANASFHFEPSWGSLGTGCISNRVLWSIRKTAPRPYAEAFAANFNGNKGSLWVSTFAESIRSLEALKALVHSGVYFQLHPWCSRIQTL